MPNIVFPRGTNNLSIKLPNYIICDMWGHYFSGRHYSSVKETFLPLGPASTNEFSGNHLKTNKTVSGHIWFLANEKYVLVRLAHKFILNVTREKADNKPLKICVF